MGCSVQSLTTDMAAVEALLEQCKEAPVEDFAEGRIVQQLHLVHRCGARLPCMSVLLAYLDAAWLVSWVQRPPPHAT